MKSHHEHAAGADLGKSATVELHDLCGASLNIVGTSTDSLTTGIGGITAEASGVLLEGVAVGAITRSAGVNCDLLVICLLAL